MPLLTWILLGVIVGYLASKLLHGASEGLGRDALLGAVGAVAGGLLFNTFALAGVTGLNLYSLIIAIAGAGLLLVGYHALRGT